MNSRIVPVDLLYQNSMIEFSISDYFLFYASVSNFMAIGYSDLIIITLQPRELHFAHQCMLHEEGHLEAKVTWNMT